MAAEGIWRREMWAAEWGWSLAPPPTSVPAAWPPPASWARLRWHSPPHPHSTSYPAQHKQQNNDHNLILPGNNDNNLILPGSTHINIKTVTKPKSRA